MCVKFAREALLSGYVEELNCETRDYKESVDSAMVCKKFKVSSICQVKSISGMTSLTSKTVVLSV